MTKILGSWRVAVFIERNALPVRTSSDRVRRNHCDLKPHNGEHTGTVLFTSNLK